MKAEQPARMFPAHAILSAWREQMAHIAESQVLRQQFLCEQHELAPKFAEHFRGLRNLPRHRRRHLQRRWKQPLAGIALLLSLSQEPVFAATINVSAICTLVDAITAANTDAAVGGCTAGSGPDLVVLEPESTHTLIAANNGITGLPAISSEIIIAGNDSTIRRDPAAPTFRIFLVETTGALTLRRLSIRGGGGGVGFGGGVFNRGTLSLVDSRISGNFAGTSGGGVANFAGTGYTGNFTLTNSTIAGNTSDRGGGLFNLGNATLRDSTVSGNIASHGGGTDNDGYLQVFGSTCAGNTASARGGALFNRTDRTASLTNSTLSGNSATAGGGALNEGVLAVTNSTLSGNSADDAGGALNGGVLTITSSTVADNSAVATGGLANGGVLTLARSLISGNAGINPEVSNNGTVIANRSNLFGYGGNAGVTGFTPGATDMVPTVALRAILNPILARNGGFTRTHALVLGSPAVDSAGNCQTGSPAVFQDQRGANRPFDGDANGNHFCDIGAFELTTCGGRIPTRVGTVRSEVIRGTPGGDVIEGLAGNDRLIGLAGNDILCGGVGRDVMNGGLGVDAVAFTGGLLPEGAPSGVKVNLATGTATGEAIDNPPDRLSGIENVIGSGGPDVITGNAGPNVLIGGRRNDVLNGVGGNDRLLGGDGADRLNGGPGLDRCDGGPPTTGDTAVNCEQVSNVP